MSARLRAAGGNASPAVEVHRLRKTHPGGVEAVRGIDFQVAPGEVFGACLARTAQASPPPSGC